MSTTSRQCKVSDHYTKLINLIVCTYSKYGKLQFVCCLVLTSLLNNRGHIAMVPACSSGTLTNVLPHRNAMPQTQDMTCHPSQYTDTGPTCRCAIHQCGMSHWNIQLPILMSWVRQSSRHSTHSSERSTL